MKLNNFQDNSRLIITAVIAFFCSISYAMANDINLKTCIEMELLDNNLFKCELSGQFVSTDTISNNFIENQVGLVEPSNGERIFNIIKYDKNLINLKKDTLSIAKSGITPIVISCRIDDKTYLDTLILFSFKYSSKYLPVIERFNKNNKLIYKDYLEGNVQNKSFEHINFKTIVPIDSNKQVDLINFLNSLNSYNCINDINKLIGSSQKNGPNTISTHADKIILTFSIQEKRKNKSIKIIENRINDKWLENQITVLIDSVSTGYSFDRISNVPISLNQTLNVNIIKE